MIGLGLFNLVPSWVYAMAVAALLASTATLGYAWLGARDDVATLRAQYNQTANAAGLCSKGVADMQTRAADAAEVAAPRRAAAAASAAAADKRADQILASSPTTPTNDCKSAADQVDAWLSTRSTP